MGFFNHLLQRPVTRVAVFSSWFLALFLVFANIAINVMGAPRTTVVRAQNLQDFSQAGQIAGLVDHRQVSGAENLLTVITPTVVPSPSPTTAPDDILAKNNITPDASKEATYTIALYGDSMIDTLGDSIPYFDKQLTKRFPNATFSIMNYGEGAQNVEEGLRRFDEPFLYRLRSYPPVATIEPDIIILGSFAYNPFDPHDRDKHWLTFAKLIEQARKTGAQVYVLAEVAPRRYEFGAGAQGVNWEPAIAYEHSGKIVQQLENVIGLAKNFNVTLIDTYTESLISKNKSEGKAEYVNKIDGIHPSQKGQEYMIDKIVTTLSL